MADWHTARAITVRKAVNSVVLDQDAKTDIEWCLFPDGTLGVRYRNASGESHTNLYSPRDWYRMEATNL